VTTQCADGVYPVCTLVPEGLEAQEKIRGELRERIDALTGMDENGARAIAVDTVKAGLSALAVETQIRRQGGFCAQVLEGGRGRCGG
jgi:hypothetical protein